MVQRFRVSKYKSVLLTCLIPDPRDPVGADSYPYTSLKYAHTSLKDGGVGDEPSPTPPHTDPHFLRPRLSEQRVRAPMLSRYSPAW